MRKAKFSWARSVLLSLRKIIKLSIYSGFYSIFTLSLYANYRHKVQSGDIPELIKTENLVSIVEKFDINPEKYFTLPYTDKESFLEYVLDDPDSRISNQFHIPEGLRSRVHFWMKVYNLYSNNQVILHDIDNPWKIYDVVDVSGLSKKESREKVREARLRFKNSSSHIREQQGMRNSIAYALQQSGRYMEGMEEIFTKHRLPLELVRLPIVESSFKPTAYSNVGAAGMWQFMRKTGKHFLDQINNQIDERLSPFKATEAAAQLMKENFQILGTWPLAVSAYHHGPGVLIQAQKKLNTNNLARIVQKFNHPTYGFASQNYYAEFVAALFTEQYKDKLFEDVEVLSPLEHDDIILEYSMRVQTILDLCKLSLEALKKYNPDLKHKAFSSSYYLPEGHWLKLPPRTKKPLEEFHEEARRAKEFIKQLEKKRS